MLDKLNIDDFEKRIGETFHVTHQEGEPFELELRRADVSQYHELEDENAQKERERKPFSVEFHSRRNEHVPQQLFSVKHDDMGEFDLFLVPLGPDAEGHRYEAVFG